MLREAALPAMYQGILKLMQFPEASVITGLLQYVLESTRADMHSLSTTLILPRVFGAAEESGDAAWYGKSVFNCRR